MVKGKTKQKVKILKLSYSPYLADFSLRFFLIKYLQLAVTIITAVRTVITRPIKLPITELGTDEWLSEYSINKRICHADIITSGCCQSRRNKKHVYDAYNNLNLQTYHESNQGSRYTQILSPGKTFILLGPFVLGADQIDDQTNCQNKDDFTLYDVCLYSKSFLFHNTTVSCCCRFCNETVHEKGPDTISE